MADLVETLTCDGQTIAIIVRRDFTVEGIKFLAPDDFALQLGHMSRPAGYRVTPHVHHPVLRQTVGTQEVLFVKTGRIRVDFYSFGQKSVGSRELTAGDLVLLSGAGHGIEVLEDATIVEVKNGPFIEGTDKGRFAGRPGSS